uniref:Uncharacterized protein n=1 Tax=Pyxicephalus adspersus TaxID=30357 RepID=A0AAV2ZVR1_PYXAD|nr:TPA: hypothetical protein GDO54_002285 [Pyxicephalus adspersus]
MWPISDHMTPKSGVSPACSILYNAEDPGARPLHWAKEIVFHRQIWMPELPKSQCQVVRWPMTERGQMIQVAHRAKSRCWKEISCAGDHL